MEDLFSQYQEVIKTNDEFKTFRKFYKHRMKPIREWVANKLTAVVNVKNDTKSVSLRITGNELYSKKYFKRSIEFYTKSLNYASYNSESYGLALANRSAVFFSLQNYENCLKDINLCLRTKYPDKLRIKVLLRRCECLKRLGRNTEFEEAISEILQYLEVSDSPEKEKQQTILESLREMQVNISESNTTQTLTLDHLKYKANERFLGATTKVKLCYDETRGRHVRASANLKRGDILFVEKAFSFVPIFTENKEVVPNKCTHCLGDTICSVPCKSCTVSIYCSETCRDESWKQTHLFECKGMQTDFWYNIGIGYPAFRTLLKGVRSGFKTSPNCFYKDTWDYGDKDDNYGYFDRLVSHLHTMDNCTPLFVKAGVLVEYLEKQTDFFSWLSIQPQSPRGTVDELRVFIGGLLVRHIKQHSCNSSVIEHWDLEAKDELKLPNEVVHIACGIFPSLSMMNHSCKPNVTIYYIKDTVVVQSVDNVKSGDEIFNCYGPDYRYLERNNRLDHLSSFYNFDCRCEICINPLLELDILDSYLCSACSGPVTACAETKTIATCQSCLRRIQLGPLLIEEDRCKVLMKQFEAGNNKETLDRIHKIYNQIFNKQHQKFEELYKCFFNYHFARREFTKALEYFQKSYEIVEGHLGRNGRAMGKDLYSVVIRFVEYFESVSGEEIFQLRGIISDVKNICIEAKKILSLYYPPQLLEVSQTEQTLQAIENVIKLQNEL